MWKKTRILTNTIRVEDEIMKELTRLDKHAISARDIKIVSINEDSLYIYYYEQPF